MTSSDLTTLCFEEWNKIRHDLAHLVRRDLEDGARLTRTKLIDNLMTEVCDCSDDYYNHINADCYEEAQKSYARGYILLRMVLSELKFNKLEDRVLYNQVNDAFLQLAFSFDLLKSVKEVVDVMSSQPEFSFAMDPALRVKAVHSPVVGHNVAKQHVSRHGVSYDGGEKVVNRPMTNGSDPQNIPPLPPKVPASKIQPADRSGGGSAYDGRSVDQAYNMRSLNHALPVIPDTGLKRTPSKPPRRAPPKPQNTYREEELTPRRITNADLSSFLFSEKNYQKPNMLLLVDIRPKDDFNAAHINYENTVSIDPRLLQMCDSDMELEERLLKWSQEDYTKFFYRDDYKLIAFYSEDSKPCDALEVFFRIMTSPEVEKRALNNPVIVSGGFSEWLKWYGNDPHKTVGVNLDSTIAAPASRRASVADRPYMPPPQYDLNTRNYSVSPEGRGTPLKREVSEPQKPIGNIPPIPQGIHRTDTSFSTVSTPGYQSYPPQETPTPPSQSYQRYVHPSSSSIARQQPESPHSINACGLINNGSTCYINSMLQCLFNYAPLEEMFRGQYLELLADPSSSGTLSSAFHRVFNYMSTHPGAYFYPSEFLKRCSSLNPSLGIPHEQQDTQEFLNFVLETLNKELSYEQAVITYYPESVELYSPDPAYLKWFEAEVKLDGVSPINGLFQGQGQSTLVCGRCGHQSSNYARFNVLSVNMPNRSRAPVLALEECIEYYLADEILSESEGNAWNCPECEKLQKIISKSPEKKKSKRFFHSSKKESNGDPTETPPSPATINHAKEVISQENVSMRRSKFLHLPRLLVVHLARFGPMGTKLNYPISYPLILDIPEGSRMVRYKLHSLINHEGTLKSGHYTALVNKSHQLKNPFWCYCDDERIVSPVAHGDYKHNVRRLESEKVYLLFYQKIAQT
ncbi:unnamed protein product [Kuraishia capsulata CBS 1993]|uniref:Ubiquitin carboxyl-terminal hydrolase n=1 Tax=Kuraishia capsulata CBS 1993 TaxID=1382522 RepID=W6MTX3_9ASCO|nr:uncharacterized protein KUCA_T00005957001 [Kuraishia capsulata CBS 1993]CDK29963.1 unnamed protein product [Kuraishia capsulata CBS 1993]